MSDPSRNPSETDSAAPGAASPEAGPAVKTPTVETPAMDTPTGDTHAVETPAGETGKAALPFSGPGVRQKLPGLRYVLLQKGVAAKAVAAALPQKQQRVHRIVNLRTYAEPWEVRKLMQSLDVPYEALVTVPENAEDMSSRKRRRTGTASPEGEADPPQGATRAREPLDADDEPDADENVLDAEDMGGAPLAHDLGDQPTINDISPAALAREYARRRTEIATVPPRVPQTEAGLTLMLHTAEGSYTVSSPERLTEAALVKMAKALAVLAG